MDKKDKYSGQDVIRKQLTQEYCLIKTQWRLEMNVDEKVGLGQRIK